MTKTKAAAEKTISAAELNFKNGADAFKAGFEKTAAAYDTVLSYGKDTAEAYLKSATIAGKGLETINSEIYSFSKAAVEDSIDWAHERAPVGADGGECKQAHPVEEPGHLLGAKTPLGRVDREQVAARAGVTRVDQPLERRAVLVGLVHA